MIRLLMLAAVAGVLSYLVLRWRRERREDAFARARAAFFVRSAEPLAARREPIALREVSLADGRLRFRVPAAWEAEPSRRGTFEARASSSRRLHVEVRPNEEGATDVERIADALRQSGPGQRGVVEVLGRDRVLLKHVRADPGPGEPGLVYCWELWIPRPDGGALVGDFSFLVPAAAAGAITEDDLRLLEREIGGATLTDSP